MRIAKQRRSYGWVAWVLIFALIAIGSVWAYWRFIAGPSNDSSLVQEAQEDEAAIPSVSKVESTVLFTGNVFWGRYTDQKAMASSEKYARPFSRLNEFDRGAYNAWISGLECPMKASVHMTAAEQEKELQFNCSPEYLTEAKKWFTAFSLANNHTDNQGVDGFAETRKHLEENDIQHVGHYDPAVIDDICEIIALPVTITNDDNTTKDGALPVALCAYHGVFKIPSQEAINEIKKYSEYMPVIALPHMGAEYTAAPDQIKTDFYRSLIDAGADMVMGDHPHWVQTTESYKGHLIVYSMGNFMFDQNWNPELMRSAAIKTVFTITRNNNQDIEKWLALGDSCKTFKDNCLTQASQQHLKKLEVKYAFGVVGTQTSDTITHPASEAIKEVILRRLSWQSTIEQLQNPYQSL